MRFQKGQSGNPGGKPKELKGIVDMARVHCPMAIEQLAKLAKSATSESARVQACAALLDRGYGKPPQSIEDARKTAFRPADDMTDDELAACIQELRAERKGAHGGAENTGEQRTATPLNGRRH